MCLDAPQKLVIGRTMTDDNEGTAGGEVISDPEQTTGTSHLRKVEVPLADVRWDLRNRFHCGGVLMVESRSSDEGQDKPL